MVTVSQNQIIIIIIIWASACILIAYLKKGLMGGGSNKDILHPG